LLTDKHENTETLIQAITQLYLKGVDSRQLAFLKVGFVKNDKDSKGTLKIVKFRNVFNTIMKQTHQDDQEIFDIIINYVSRGEESATEVNFERLNILIEAFHFYPLIIKRDKNVSSSIYQILNSNKGNSQQSQQVSISVLNVLSQLPKDQ
jgi:uncharacterized protein YdeI (YjbR/CyaY-like superfamily)